MQDDEICRECLEKVPHLTPWFESFASTEDLMAAVARGEVIFAIIRFRAGMAGISGMLPIFIPFNEISGKSAAELEDRRSREVAKVIHQHTHATGQ